MTVSEVTASIVKQYAAIETDEDDTLIESVIMPAARAHICTYTGLSADALDGHESLTIAYIALCAFLYDNRSLTITNEKQNAVIRSFLDCHSVNLV